MDRDGRSDDGRQLLERREQLLGLADRERLRLCDDEAGHDAFLRLRLEDVDRASYAEERCHHRDRAQPWRCDRRADLARRWLWRHHGEPVLLTRLRADLDGAAEVAVRGESRAAARAGRQHAAREWRRLRRY